jgi:hypothetical protein
MESLDPRGLTPLHFVDLSGPVGLAQCARWTSGEHPGAHASDTLRHMILDSSMGNLIRNPEPPPAERQNSRGEDSEGKIILDSSGGSNCLGCQAH